MGVRHNWRQKIHINSKGIVHKNILQYQNNIFLNVMFGKYVKSSSLPNKEWSGLFVFTLFKVQEKQKFSSGFFCISMTIF